MKYIILAIKIKKRITHKELTDQIPEDLGKKVLEIAEDRELDMANSKKNKQRKKSIDILNENIDDLYQKTINESKAETKGTDSLSKNSKLGKKRKIEFIHIELGI